MLLPPRLQFFHYSFFLLIIFSLLFLIYMCVLIYRYFCRIHRLRTCVFCFCFQRCHYFTSLSPIPLWFFYLFVSSCWCLSIRRATYQPSCCIWWPSLQACQRAVHRLPRPILFPFVRRKFHYSVVSPQRELAHAHPNSTTATTCFLKQNKLLCRLSAQ